MINLDILSLSPLGCMLSYNYYTSLVTHTVLPLLAVGALLLVRTALKASGHPAIGTRCVTASHATRAVDSDHTRPPPGRLRR